MAPILVTGAAGKTGLAVIRALAERGAPVRALVHRPKHVAQVEAAGAQETVVGDLRDQKAMVRAARGVRAA
jgi:NAD(P)H dehydrogenase (quinone)